MTLRRKTLLAISVTLIGVVALLFIIVYSIMNDTFATLDRQSSLRNLDRASNIFQDNVDNLSRAARDWAMWDETYRFVSDANAAYIDENLNDDTFWGLNVNFVVFLNKDSEIVYAKALALNPDWQNTFLDRFEAYTKSNETFLRLTTSISTRGFVLIGGEPTLITSRPILRSDGTGPKAGTLIFGQLMGTEELAIIGQSLRLSLDLLNADAPDLSSDAQAAKAELSPASLRTTAALDEQTIAAYTYVNDIFGQQSLMLRTSQERSAYLQGQPSLSTILAVLVLGGIVAGAVILLLLERMIFSQVSAMNEQLKHAGKDHSVRLQVNGRDELAQLASTINTTFAAVAQAQAELEQATRSLQVEGGERTAELERQKQKFQSIIDTMGAGVVYCENGRIGYVNRAFVELLQYEVDDLIGKPFALLNKQLDPSETPIYFTTPKQYEMMLTRRDGTSMDAAIITTPVEKGEKQHSQVVVVRDITQELALKRQKDFFFARASHDLRAPLTSIMTRLYILGKRPQELEMHLKVLNQISTHMLELVKDLLDVSRFERGTNVLHRRDLVLQTLVDQVVEVQQADAELKQIELTTRSVEIPLHVYGDPTRLHQVLINLVSNAIHYTPPRGSVMVDVGLEYYNGEKCALIKVIDTGIGIDTEHLINIFDPFFRVSSEDGGGSGLGLYIVREIVQMHGGDIRVSSEVDRGTTFSVRLVLSDALPAVSAAVKTASSHLTA